MNRIFKRAFLPSLMAASVASVSLVPAQPAAADNRVLEDAAIGAGVGVVTGAFTRCGSVVGNAARGAATGAAVNGANGLRRNRRNRSLIQDLGVGVGAGVVSGAVTNNRCGILKNGASGAATGGVIHIYRNRRR